MGMRGMDKRKRNVTRCEWQTVLCLQRLWGFGGLCLRLQTGHVRMIQVV